MLRLLLISSLSFVTLRCGVALGMPAARQESQLKAEPVCLQKDRLKEGIDAALSTKTSQLFARSSCPPVNFVDPPRKRNDLGKVLNQLRLDGIGVEVGVKRGEYTQALLEQWQHARLFVQVDLWEHQEHYKDIANVNSRTHAAFMKESCSKGQSMKRRGYAGEIIQCRDYSTECAKLFPNASIDFLYIDARHDRHGVLEDLQAYWPKVKIGGVVSGHDYVEQYEVKPTGQDWTINGDGSKDETGGVVRGAVNDFFRGNLPDSPRDLRECPRQPVITYREQMWNTWIVRK